MNKPTVIDNVKLIEELWPSMEMTDALGELWIKALRPHNQLRVHEAIQQVRMKYSSRTPEIKWVLSEIESMKRHVAEESQAKRIEAERERLRQERFACIEDQRMMRAELANESSETLATAKGFLSRSGLLSPGDTHSDFYTGCLHAACAMVREGTLQQEATA